jgi:hypothetical protein
MADIPAKAAVIIVNYNGKPYIEDCLNSLSRQTYGPYEIILVDNGSQDSSVGLVERGFPQVKIIRNAENLGFARANNIGIRYALEKGCEYFVFLNYDTVVDEDFLEELVRCVNRNAQAGICQSKIYIYSQDRPGRIINSIGNEAHFLGFGFCGGLGEMDSQEYQRDREITFASGAAMLIRREVLEEIGLFDEDFFLYQEDLDLCMRARLAGWRILLASGSKVHHKYVFAKNTNRYFYTECNRLPRLFKTYETRTLLVLLPALLMMEIALLFFALWGGWLGLKLKAYIEVLRSLGKTLRKRKRLQNMRKVPDKEVLLFLTGKVDFLEMANPLIRYGYNPFMSFYWRWAKALLGISKEHPLT